MHLRRTRWSLVRGPRIPGVRSHRARGPGRKGDGGVDPAAVPDAQPARSRAHPGEALAGGGEDPQLVADPGERFDGAFELRACVAGRDLDADARQPLADDREGEPDHVDALVEQTAGELVRLLLV